MTDNYYKENELCEICKAHPDNPYNTMDIYWINTHCIELRRNRNARKNKNIKVVATVF